MAGLIDWDAIKDRGRQLNRLPHWGSPADIVEACAAQYNIDLWADQSWRVEVWTEKDAAVGVIDDLCRRYDVPYLACRGNSSTSAEYDGAMRFRRYRDKVQRCVILYAGDHDPSGVAMSAIHDRRLNEISVPVYVDQVALNLDQVRRYGLAPNPVKKADTKAKAYIDRFGEDCWEIEALDPAVLQDLIEMAILKYLDRPRFEKRLKLRDRGRAKLAKLAKSMKYEESTMTTTSTSRWLSLGWRIRRKSVPTIV